MLEWLQSVVPDEEKDKVSIANLERSNIKLFGQYKTLPGSEPFLKT